MPAVVEAPLDLVESLADLRFPAGVNARFQELMDRNTEGALAPVERAELEALVDWSEQISIIRLRAMAMLGRRPG